MNTHFKSGLNKVKAEDTLISKTEAYLKNELNKKYNSKIIKSKNGREFFMKKNLVIAASLAVLLIGGGSGAYAYYQTPQSYISVDINPSVELGVNKFDKVVKAEAYNKDGEKILNAVNVKGSDVTNALDTLISSAVDNGYVLKDGSTNISITSETDDKEVAAKLEDEAEDGVKEALKESGQTAVINKDNVALARRDEARALGITPGKLNLINKLQAVDSTATIEQYKNASVKDIMKAVQAKKENGNKKENKKENKNQGDATTVNQGDTTTVNQGDTTIKDQGKESTVNQDETTSDNQSKPSTVSKGNSDDKKQGGISNKNQGSTSNTSTTTNTNTNSNADINKNTNSHDGGGATNGNGNGKGKQ